MVSVLKTQFVIKSIPPGNVLARIAHCGVLGQVAQATYKANPLSRATTYLDPLTGKWQPWTKVDWNRLY